LKLGHLPKTRYPSKYFEKENPSNADKPDSTGSSKLLKDAKDGNGEELVRDYTVHILNIFYHDIIVRGRPAAQGSIRNAGRAIEGLNCVAPPWNLCAYDLDFIHEISADSAETTKVPPTSLY
jgi:hypothetical protein